MKNAIVIITVIILILLMLCGCRSTITHYDKAGKVIKVEEVTNLSRIADGTNSKSQMLLIEGTYISSDFSATAGEGYIPGWVIKFANGKTAIINAKDNKFSGSSKVLEKFFSEYEITNGGIKNK